MNLIMVLRANFFLIIVSYVNSFFIKTSSLEQLYLKSKSSIPYINKKLYKNLKASNNEEIDHNVNYNELPSTGAWLPFIVISCNDDTLPLEIKVAGDNYVVWRNPLDLDNPKSLGYSIMLDLCPHRLAPLSQGRVDPVTGCIECPYHGWQFESSNGQCKTIPQMESTCTIRKPYASTIPVHVTGDILWGFIPLPLNEQASFYPTLPEDLFPQLKEKNNFKMRDLPYSFDFLVENFMDPAHIPFAHHSLQAKRSDGSPLPMKILTDINNNHTTIEVSFQDTINNRTREGIVSFIAPCYYHFRTKDVKTNNYSISLLGLIVPTVPGQCRLIFSLFFKVAIANKIPKSLDHALSMKFLDSDLWVHEQEVAIRNINRNSFLKQNNHLTNNNILSNNNLIDNNDNNNILSTNNELKKKSINDPFRNPSANLVNMNYKLLTESDTGCIAWRKWWYKHMSASPIFGASTNPPVIAKEVQYDRYNTHGKYCKHCKKLLSQGNQLKYYAPIISLFWISISKSIWSRLFGVSIYLLLINIANKMIRSVQGPERGEKVTAAQFKN